MNRSRQYLALLAGGIGTAAALLGAPLATAEGNTGCENLGGGDGGQSSECVTPGNAQLSSYPNELGVQGAEIGEGVGIFGGFR